MLANYTDCIMFFLSFKAIFLTVVLWVVTEYSHIRLPTCPSTRLLGVTKHKTTIYTYCSSCNTLFQLNVFMEQSFCNWHLNKNAHKATRSQNLPLPFLTSPRDSVTAAEFTIPGLPVLVYFPDRGILLLPLVNGFT